MPIEVLLAVLLAAALHATWNAAAKSASGEDPAHTTVAIGIGAGLAAAPALLVTGLPGAEAGLYLLASAIIHTFYFALIGLGYRAADYSVVYPLTRGSAPLVTALASAYWLGEALPAMGWIGIALLSAGVLGLGSHALRRAALDARSLGLAALIAVVIVSYTLIDGIGARRSGNAVGYVLGMLALTSVLLLPLIVRPSGFGTVRDLARRWKLALGGGAFVAMSYGTAVWAMSKAPIGMVAALRETSVLFATVIAAVVLKERFGWHRWAAAVLIVAGLGCLRLA